MWRHRPCECVPRGRDAGRVPVDLSRRARRARRSYSPQSVTAKMHRPAESDNTMAEPAGSVRPPRSPLQPLRFAHSVRRREKAAARAGTASTCRSRRDSRPCLGRLGSHRARYCRSLRAHRSGRPCPAIKPTARVARMRPISGVRVRMGASGEPSSLIARAASAKCVSRYARVSSTPPCRARRGCDERDHAKGALGMMLKWKGAEDVSERKGAQHGMLQTDYRRALRPGRPILAVRTGRAGLAFRTGRAIFPCRP
jgi:hypothetical protein